MSRSRRDPHAYAAALKAAQDRDEQRVVDELNAAIQRIAEAAPDAPETCVAVGIRDFDRTIGDPVIRCCSLDDLTFLVPGAGDRADESFGTRTTQDATGRRAMRDRLIAAAIATHDRIAGHIERIRRDPRNAAATGIPLDYESAILDGGERDDMIDAAGELVDIVNDIRRIERLMQDFGDDAITPPIRPRPTPIAPKPMTQAAMFGGNHI